MLVFEERGKPEYPEKNLSEKGENQQQTQPTYGVDAGIWTWATLVEGKRSHQSASPSLFPKKWFKEAVSYYSVLNVFFSSEMVR